MVPMLYVAVMSAVAAATLGDEHLTAIIYDVNSDGVLEEAELTEVWTGVGNGANTTQMKCVVETVRVHMNVSGVEVKKEDAGVFLEGFYLFKVAVGCRGLGVEEPSYCHALSTVAIQFRDDVIACAGEESAESEPESECTKPSSKERWGYTMLSVVVISLIAVFGIFVTLPILLAHDYLLQVMLCFAIGALLGDAFYHIVPDVLSEGEEERVKWEVYLKMTIILLSILAFYLVDHVVKGVLGGKDPHEPTTITAKDFEGAETAPEAEEGSKWWRWTPMSQVKQIVWVVVIADGVHNVTDGLSIAAAFGQSTTIGWSTVVAAALHEIPQEVGDFAVMLSSGISPFQAVILNLLSACSSIIAAVIACIVGDKSENASEWILCVTIGSFIYLALGVVMPELLHEVKEVSLIRLTGHVFGMCCGALILWVIAITENEEEC
eukprot:TRINITY_DN2172_c0_g2_i1.p1 TRINITY_DN2172_c0_g2~~TRINITY_DN2172_c0_g2_i1.p1  ORF type:complete len:436 (+),score=92.75 TRINITY_DN2172_c0_g2_i1:56-1363(+)